MFRTIIRNFQENRKRKEREAIVKELYALRNDQRMHCYCVMNRYRKDRDEIYQKLVFWIDEHEEMVCLPFMPKWTESDHQLFSDISREIRGGYELRVFQAINPWSSDVSNLLEKEEFDEAAKLLESERFEWRKNADDLIYQIEKIFSKYKISTSHEVSQ